MIAYRMRRATLHALFAALSTVLCAYAQAATIRVEAYIDGRSQLVLKAGLREQLATPLPPCLITVL